MSINNFCCGSIQQISQEGFPFPSYRGMKIQVDAQISTTQNITGQIRAEWRGQCSIITALYHYGL